MAYNATYTADDAAPIIIDFGASVVVTFVSFAAIVALVVLWAWYKKRT